MDESCGKCVPCRAGTVQMHGLLDKIAAGAGHARATSRCSRSCATWCKSTSLCGLGPDRAQPGAQHAALLPRRVRAHARRAERCPAGADAPARAARRAATAASAVMASRP
ncbi:MAG: hypothetical protein MZV65_18550 [Chromatiales bacterium]|nr:hypothetical protein [Chromatiales bacterium]